MKRDASLWLANLLGPVTWFALLTGGFYLVPPAHTTGRDGILILVNVIAIVLVIASAIIGVRELKLTAGDTSEVILQRRRFLALSALGFAAVTLLIVIGMLLATLILGTGAEP